MHMIRSILGVAHRRVLLLSAMAMALVIGVVGSASAAEPEFSVKPVTEKVTSELQANLPVILAIIGGLIALTVAVRAIRKFAKV